MYYEFVSYKHQDSSSPKHNFSDSPVFYILACI